MAYAIMLGGTYNFITETYTLLAEELNELLSNPSELFLKADKNDILGGILAKADNVVLEYDLDPDQKDEVKALVQTTYQTVFENFAKEFEDAGSTIETTFNDISARTLAETIYKFIYMERYDVLMSYLVGNIFSNRSVYAKQYKSPDDKKDLAYQALKSELALKNSDYYTLLIHYESIIEALLTDDSSSIIDIYSYYDMSEEEAEMLEQLFGGSATQSMSVMAKSLISSDYYRDFLSALRIHLCNEIKAAV